MKRVSVPFLVVFLGFILWTSNAFSIDYNKATNNPGVWRVSKIGYDVDNDGVIDGASSFTYNAIGEYLTKKDVRWNSPLYSTVEDLNQFHKTFYTYDGQGRLIKRQELYTHSDSDSTETHHYSYDTSGNMVEKLVEDSYGRNYKEFYKYDSRGRYTNVERYKFGGCQASCHFY